MLINDPDQDGTKLWRGRGEDSIVQFALSIYMQLLLDKSSYALAIKDYIFQNRSEMLRVTGGKDLGKLVAALLDSLEVRPSGIRWHFDSGLVEWQGKSGTDRPR